MVNPPQPPKLPEIRQASKVDRRTAWGYVMSNLALPGLGTFLARDRLAGALQLVASQIGFLLTVLWAVAYVRNWIREGKMPEGLGPHFRLALIGIVLFLLAWAWSVASSLQILRDTRKTDA